MRHTIKGGLILAATLGLALAAPIAASATEAPAFTPHAESARWLLPASWPAGTTPSYQPAIFPQAPLTEALPCGRWSQDDHYWIATAEQQALYDSLDDDGQLTQGEDSAIYQSHTFTYGGDCPVVVPVYASATLDVTPPTCELPVNTITVTAANATVNGWATGSYSAEQIAADNALTDIYAAAWVVPVIVADGALYDGAATIEFTLVDPAGLDCDDTEPPTDEPELTSSTTDDTLAHTPGGENAWWLLPAALLATFGGILLTRLRRRA